MEFAARRAADNSEELGDDTASCDHYSGGSEFDGIPGFTRLKEINGEVTEELDSILREVVSPYLRRLGESKFTPTRKYSSEVVVFQDDHHRRRCLQRLDRYAIDYPGKLLLWVDEGDHLHIIHDCPRSNGQCRCLFGQTEDFRKHFRKPMRRIKFITELSTTDWTNVFLYFVVSKRSSSPQVWIGGRLQRLPSDDQIVRWREVQNTTRDLLGRQNSGIGHNLFEEESRLSNDTDHLSENGGIVGQAKRKRAVDSTKRKKTKFERVSAQVLSLLTEYFCIPSTDIRKILIHSPDSLDLYDPGNEKMYDAACQLLEHRFVDYNLLDLYNLYKDKMPIFYANNINPYMYYHNLDYSTDIIDKLIRFQLGDDDERVVKFLENVRDWFNKFGWERNPKINAIAIIGPPNCGKNYFWDMLGAIAYNTGHIGRVNNKTNRFALQDCYQRRFIMGNEISMEDGALEDFKKLCEGASLNINVKFKGDKIYTRAPVCLISNKTLDICYMSAFKDVRLKTLYWMQADFLKDSDKKPYPLCIFNIFEKYNISLI